MNKFFLITVAIFILSSSCSHFAGKKQATEEIVALGHQKDIECTKGDKESCKSYLKIHDEFKLPYKTLLESNQKILQITSHLCLNENEFKFCKRAAGAALICKDNELLAKLCFSTKDPGACGEFYEMNDRLEKPDIEKGLLSLQYSCSNKNINSCNILYTNSLKNKTDRYLIAACNEDKIYACYHAGIFGRETKSDPRNRIGYYEKACKLGLKDGCALIPSIPAAIIVYDCEEKKIPSSCLEASKTASKENIHQAIEFAHKGCNSNHQPSCNQELELRSYLIDKKAEQKRKFSEAWNAASATVKTYPQGMIVTPDVNPAVIPNTMKVVSKPKGADYSGTTNIPVNQFEQSSSNTDKKACNCKGYAGPGGPCYNGPGGGGYTGPGGAAYAGPGGPCYDGPGGAAYDGPGGSAYSGPGGPAYSGAGGPAYDGPGGPCDDGPGGPAYSGPGGPCYSGPGGTGEKCPAICR